MTQIKEKVKDAKRHKQNPMQILEEALTTCKFGKFQIRLMILSQIASIAGLTVAISSSFVLPVAECDLNMNLVQKGLLNAIPFAGSVITSVFTGFIADTFGRKKCIVTGYFGLFFCSIIQGSSQNYWMLIIGKLLDGIFGGLCVNPSLSLISELVHKEVRDIVMMVGIIMMAISLMVSPLFAWLILPQQWHFVFWGGSFELHSWNIFLYFWAIWKLLTAVLYCFIPESPKYLFNQGREVEALDVLKKIYNINTGLPKESFPIKYLNIEGNAKPINKKSDIKTKIIKGIRELKPLFRYPLLKHLIILNVMSFGFLLCYSTLHLWLPQMTTIIENYQSNHGETHQLCVMINDYTDNLVSKIPSGDNITEAEICIPQLSGSQTYINGIIFGIASAICGIISSYIITLLDIKLMMSMLLVLCAGGAFSLYWTYTSLQLAVLLSTTCSFMMTVMGLQGIIQVRAFPTSLRTICLSINSAVGLIGSLIGNLLFPVLLQNGCMPPFMTIAAIILGTSFLVYFLPNPQKENSETGDE